MSHNKDVGGGIGDVKAGALKLRIRITELLCIEISSSFKSLLGKSEYAYSYRK